MNSPKTTVCGRFAPSPSGRMHLGNVFCALLAWLSVRSQNGRMLLRIEDLDPDRCKPEYTSQLLDDLRWLGLTWDQPFLRNTDYQSQCFSLYAAAFRALSAQGLVYPCFCSRAALHDASAPHLSDGRVIYAGTCRNLSAEEIAAQSAVKAPAYRLRVPAETIIFTDRLCGTVSENLAHTCGDFVVCRADGVYAYQLAVVVDDGRMGVTEVLRGQDLLSSTARQIYLQRLLGLSTPSYCHIPLLVAPDGRRLSKRDKDLDMGALRKRFSSPEPLLGILAAGCGLLPRSEPISAQELIQFFDFSKLPHANICISDAFF